MIANVRKMAVWATIVVVCHTPFDLHAEPVCVQSRSTGGLDIAYMGVGAWVSNYKNLFFVLSGDALSKTIEHGEPFLGLSCGKSGEVLGYGESGVLYRYALDELVPDKVTVPGKLAYADGEFFYSFDSGKGGANTYSTFVTRKNGATTELVENAPSPGEGYGGYFYQTKRGGYDVYKDGRRVAAVENPVKYIHPLSGQGFSDYRRCGADGIFVGRKPDTLYLRSGARYFPLAFGDAAITKIDFLPRCAEQVVLLFERKTQKSVLVSLKPGKKLEKTALPLSCNADSFSLNVDKSIHYRCGRTFYYKPPSRDKSVWLGDMPPSFAGSGDEQWLSTADFGTLYVYVTDASQSKPQQACFARLLPDSLVNIGCTEVDTPKH